MYIKKTTIIKYKKIQHINKINIRISNNKYSISFK